MKFRQLFHSMSMKWPLASTRTHKHAQRHTHIRTIIHQIHSFYPLTCLLVLLLIKKYNLSFALFSSSKTKIKINAKLIGSSLRMHTNVFWFMMPDNERTIFSCCCFRWSNNCFRTEFLFIRFLNWLSGFVRVSRMKCTPIYVYVVYLLFVFFFFFSAEN